MFRLPRRRVADRTRISPVVKGLGVLPADFSDPLFNSREPADDWKMVIKYGGHALGLAGADAGPGRRTE